MAVTITDSDVYQSGSGGFLASHTMTDIDCSGSNTYAVAAGFNRNPASDVSSWTFEGNTPDNLYDNINTNVVAVSTKGYKITDGDLTIISNTPSFKLQAMIGVAMAGVDQTTPNATTGTNTANGFGASATLAYTGTAGNMLLVFVGTQTDKTYTASNCTALQSVTSADANLGSGFCGYVTATGSSQTIGATWTGNDNYRLVIIEVKAAATDPTISVSDTTTLTESVNATLVHNVNKSESVTVTDTVIDIIRGDTRDVNKTENVTVTESATVLIPELKINKSESITVAEALATPEVSYGVIVTPGIQQIQGVRIV